MQENKSPVLVKVTASERDEHGRQGNRMQMLMPGLLTERADGWLLQYQETMEDEGDHTSVTQDVRVMAREGHVTVLRKGAYNMLIVLERGKRYQGTYHTPYGDMAMAVYPTVIKTDLNAGRGLIELEYQLDMAGGYAAVRRMQIEYNVQSGRELS